MKFGETLSDDAVLTELGQRVAQLRLARNLTQADLAAEAGVSTSTLARLEAGAVATQLSGLVRVCRALGIVDRFELLLPETGPGPMDQLRARGSSAETRPPRAQRARPASSGQAKATTWTWGDES